MNIRSTTHTLPLKKRTQRFIHFRKVIDRFIPNRRGRVIRHALIAVNAMLLVSVLGFVLSSPGGSDVASRSALANSDQIADPLDQLSASDIAVQVAQLNNLPEATAVIEQADTISGQQAIVSSDSQVVTRPQIVNTDARSYRDIQVYVTKEGDTISSIAQQFGVTSDSIQWSNGLEGDSVTPGHELYIPPTNGIVYLIKAGDTVDSLAREFNADAAAITAFNDVESRGLPVGQRIVIPGGTRVTRSVTRYSSGGGTWGSRTLSYAGNTYTRGYCTWHVYNERAAAGNPIPNNLGNAISWYSIASSSGIPVGNEPRAGAVLWHSNLGGLGHVGYVERVNADGSIYVSDMNYPIWNRETHRTIPPSEFGSYRFIY